MRIEGSGLGGGSVKAMLANAYSSRSAKTEKGGRSSLEDLVRIVAQHIRDYKRETSRMYMSFLSVARVSRLPAAHNLASRENIQKRKLEACGTVYEADHFNLFIPLKMLF